MVLEEFHVVMHCPTCGVPAEAWPDEVPSADLAADTAHDAENVEEIDLDCKGCGGTFSVSIRAHIGGWEVFLTSDQYETGTIEHYDYRNDEEPSPEPRAYGIYLDAIIEWQLNFRDIATENGGTSRNRMLFITLYSIFEAYLSDRITSIALIDTDVQKHLLKLDGLKDKNVSLETVLNNPGIVRDMIKTTLQGLSFHSLKNVSFICFTAFGTKILPTNSKKRELIMKSVDKRHDCVHRNGVDRDGNKHEDITKYYLWEISSIMGMIIETLEVSIRLIEEKILKSITNSKP